MTNNDWLEKIRELIGAGCCYGFVHSLGWPDEQQRARVRGINEFGWLECEIAANYELMVPPRQFTPSPDAIFFKGDGPATDEEYNEYIASVRAIFMRLGIGDQ
jgi:hypothetical protein